MNEGGIVTCLDRSSQVFGPSLPNWNPHQLWVEQGFAKSCSNAITVSQALVARSAGQNSYQIVDGFLS